MDSHIGMWYYVTWVPLTVNRGNIKNNMHTEKLETFISAFRTNMSGCRRTCHCGREYWDGGNDGYSWEDGEIEALSNNPNAVELPYTVETIEICGIEYVPDCDCWHRKAYAMLEFIDGNAVAIAQYLTLEKKRKQKIASDSPVVT